MLRGGSRRVNRRSAREQARLPPARTASSRHAARAPRCPSVANMAATESSTAPTRTSRRTLRCAPAPARSRGATRGSARRGRRGRARSASPRSPSRRGDRAQDAAALAAAELVEHGRDLGLGPPRPLGEVGGGWAIFVFERVTRKRKRSAATACSAGSSAPSASSRWFSTICCAPPSSSSRARSRSRAPPRPSRARAAPSRAGGTAPRPRRRSPPGSPRRRPRPMREPAGGGRVDHRLDQRRLDRVRLLARRQTAVPLRDRPLDRLRAPPRGRGARRGRSSRTARDAPLEAVELRPGVLAQREHEVHAQVGLVDDPRELDRERALAVLVGVVEEVLLELVEHDEQRPHALGPAAHRLDQRLAGLPRRQLLAAERLDARRPDRLGERRQRVVAPGAERADRERRPLRACRPRSRAPARAGRGRRRRGGATSCRRRSRRRGSSAGTRAGSR